MLFVDLLLTFNTAPLTLKLKPKTQAVWGSWISSSWWTGPGQWELEVTRVHSHQKHRAPAGQRAQSSAAPLVLFLWMSGHARLTCVGDRSCWRHSSRNEKGWITHDVRLKSWRVWGSEQTDFFSRQRTIELIGVQWKFKVSYAQWSVHYTINYKESIVIMGPFWSLIPLYKLKFWQSWKISWIWIQENIQECMLQMSSQCQYVVQLFWDISVFLWHPVILCLYDGLNTFQGFQFYVWNSNWQWTFDWSYFSSLRTLLDLRLLQCWPASVFI